MQTGTQQHVIDLLNATKIIQNKVYIYAYHNIRYLRQRSGQALMNGLGSAAPELYDILAGSVHDCFYDDTKISSALGELGFDETFFLNLSHLTLGQLEKKIFPINSTRQTDE